MALPFSHLQHLQSWSTFLCTLSSNYCSRGEKWFSNKGYSLCEHPWVPLCLSKASAVVKKTDSCSLSTRFCVMTRIIYLVAAMTTVGEAWCMGFLNALTTPFSLMTHAVFQQDSALHENPGVKHTEATVAKQGSAWRFEVLFIRRLWTGEGEKKKEKKDCLEIYLTVLDTVCKQRQSVQ